jgi:Fe-S cluster biosynthesis and repair protein YggX
LSRKVHCQVLGEELDGLAFQPYPGELGKRIYENVSQQAWQKWLALQTMLINEHRLSPINPEHRKYLEGEMEKYFFGEGAAAPEGYVPPENNGD